MKSALRILAVLTGLVLVLVGTMAVAAWLSSGSASATATATAVNQANAPTAARGSGQVSLSWSASTLASGAPVGGYRVVRHDGATTTDVCTVTAPTHSCTDATPVATAVTYGVIATVGTHWRGPESSATSFTYDDVAPVTTASISPTPNEAGWNNISVTVTLQATDTGSPASGVDHVTYSLDGGSTVTVAGATASLAVTGTGTHTVTYAAVDKAGNSESTGSTTVKVDPNAPLTTVTPSPGPNSNGWNNTDITLDFSSSDSTSGIASITANGSTTTVSGAPATATTSRTIGTEGTSTVSYFATDAAGNIEGAKSTTVRIDKTAPSTSINPAGSSSWIQQPSRSVTITATDGTSGVASLVYAVDGGSATTVNATTATLTLGQGDHSITYHGIDVAGNVETDHTASVRVDNVAPSTSISPGSSTSTWRSANTASVSATDATSGVASVAYKLNGASSFTTVAADSVTITGLVEGTNTVVYRATDKAGNVAADATATIKVDTVRPTVSPIGPLDSGSYKGNSGSWGKLCSGNTDGVCATIADAGGSAASGVDATTLKFTLVLNPGTGSAKCWDGSNFVTGSSCAVSLSYAAGTGYASSPVPSSKMAIGTYSLTYSAKDVAGNSVLASALSFTITS